MIFFSKSHENVCSDEGISGREGNTSDAEAMIWSPLKGRVTGRHRWWGVALRCADAGLGPGPWPIGRWEGHLASRWWGRGSCGSFLCFECEINEVLRWGEALWIILNVQGAGLGGDGNPPYGRVNWFWMNESLKNQCPRWRYPSGGGWASARRFMDSDVGASLHQASVSSAAGSCALSTSWGTDHRDGGGGGRKGLSHRAEPSQAWWEAGSEVRSGDAACVAASMRHLAHSPFLSCSFLSSLSVLSSARPSSVAASLVIIVSSTVFFRRTHFFCSLLFFFSLWWCAWLNV